MTIEEALTPEHMKQSMKLSIEDEKKMKEKVKSIRNTIKLATPEKPYGKKGDEIWSLPLVENASGVKHSDIIAEVDDGYLIINNRKYTIQSVVQYLPKSSVQA